MGMIVDADTHVAESASMWELLDESMHHRRPVVCKVPDDTLYGPRNAFWLIDGNMFPKPAGKGSFRLITPSESDLESSRSDITIRCREITDPRARLRDMDRLGVDVQVIYPTLFLMYVTDDADLEIALTRAYNRWMWQVWEKSDGRLRWTCVPPLRNVEASLDEIEQAKEHGAVGIFFRGMEGERTLDDPYFFPVYEHASRLNLPICVHTGAGCPTLTNMFDHARHGVFHSLLVLPVFAFRDLVANHIPERFPDLRFGFIEAAASWIPYVLHVVQRRRKVEGPRAADWGPSFFRDNRLYIACEADEDIPYLAQFVGEDNLIIGSDYGHNDPAEERQLVATIRGRNDLPGALADKLLGENARRLYALAPDAASG